MDRLVFAGLALCAQSAWGQAVGPALFEGRGPKEPAERAAAAQPPSFGLSLPEPAAVRLPALGPDDLERLQPQGGLTPVGVHRQLPEGAAALSFADGAAKTTVAGAWQATVAGRIWRLRVTSPGARALRIHFQDFDAGAGNVWIHGADGQVDGPYSGRGMYGDGDFWSDIVFGGSATIEYLPDPTVADREAAPFRIAAVSHIQDSSGLFGTGGLPIQDTKSASLLPEKNVASCHLDVSCYSDWSEEATAVALIAFEEDGESYVCSGALLNDRVEGSYIPYFLTAAHCVNTDAVARSVIVYWRYQTGACNGFPPSRGSVPRTNGARLLAAMDGALCTNEDGEGEICTWQGGDATLLRLTEDPPSGIWFLGWDPNTQSVGSRITEIHHSDGSFKRISFGRIESRRTGGFFNHVSYAEGTVEPGSSGSPIFDESGYVIGVAGYGDPDVDVCAFPRNSGYTRFSVFYPRIRRYLEGESGSSSPPTVSLTAFPSSIRRGQSTTLQWRSTNAESARISPGIGTIGTSGSRRVSPTATTTYRITVTNAEGRTATDSVRVTVTAPLPTVSLTARPSSIRRGESATLQWSSTNAASARISPGIGAVGTSGSRRVSPTATTTYRITVTNADGRTAADSATVAVTAPPPSEPVVGGLLTSGQSRRFRLEPVDNPTIFTGGYSYRLDVPTNASRATFTLSSVTRSVDVDLYVRFGEDNEVRDGRAVSDYSSATTSGDEEIVITRSSSPPLRAGAYFVSLALYDTGAVSEGTLTATLETDASPAGPRISSGGVVTATGAPPVRRISPNALISVFGQEFAPQGTQALNAVLDSAGRIAANLADTCLEIGGRRTPLFTVTPSQINAQAPRDLLPGQVQAAVIRGCGTGSEQRGPAETVAVAAVSPAFFNFPVDAEGRNPVVALHGGGPGLVGPPGLIPGVPFTPAAPGEIVTLYGTGFGATDPPLATGQIPGGAAELTNEVSFTFGGIAVPSWDVLYAGAAPCCAGLYQFTVRLPTVVPDGNAAVSATVRGVSTPRGPFLAVRRQQ